MLTFCSCQLNSDPAQLLGWRILDLNSAETVRGVSKAEFELGA